MTLGPRLACALAIGLVAAAPASAERPSTPQRIARLAKPAVVRVWGAFVATFELRGERYQEAVGGSGTGFFISPDGDIATNAHVVADIHAGEDAARKQLSEALFKDVYARHKNVLNAMSSSELRALGREVKLVELKRWAYVVLQDGQKLDYDIEAYGKPGTGRDCAVIKVKIANAPTLPLGDSARTQVEDRVVVIGYPGVADFKDLLDEKSQLQPSVTDGAVSSLKRAASGEPILQISAPITHGNSGGPAIDERGNVIGLATFGNEGEVQGFNFLVASATLLALVHDAHRTPHRGPTDAAWQAGLEHYWADEYTAAIAKLEEVKRLFPAHPEVAAMIRASQEAQREGKEKQPPSHDGLIAGLVAGGLAVLVIAVLVIARRGKRAGAAPGTPGARPPGAAPGGPPRMPAPVPGTPQLYGRVTPGAPAPIAKTVAIGAGPPSAGGIAPTAFGSLSIGSLTCTRGQLVGQRYALTATGMIIGRQPGVAHILVNDHRASGKHVWIGIDNGQLVAIDQGTTNGTYLNDVGRGRITRATLRDGDTIIVGEPDCLSLQVRLT